MNRFFQTIGIVFSLILFAVVTVGIMYLSYIMGIGLLIAGTIFIVYNMLPKAGLSRAELVEGLTLP